MFAYILVSISILCAAVGQIAMKVGMSQVGEISSAGQLFNFSTILNIFTTPAVLAGIFSYVVSLFLWLGALSNLSVSVAYPLLSLAYIVTAILAFFFLKENLTLLHGLGIVLVIGGCFLIIRASS